MTIAKRLALLIVIALIGLVVIGGVGLKQMSSINGSLRYAHDNSIPSIKKVASIESTFLRMRTHVLSYLLSNDEQR
jgi:methyl-accepting chemotaxis protein